MFQIEFHNDCILDTPNKHLLYVMDIKVVWLTINR